MDQDHIELPGQAYGSHIPQVVLDPGVERLREGQHFCREINGRRVKLRGKMGQKVAPAHSQFQQRMAAWAKLRQNNLPQLPGFLRILFRRTDNRPEV
jgi:hypothetical protein